MTVSELERRNTMNIRKTLLLTLVIVIAFVGLTLTGCEKKSDHPTGEHPTTEAKAICPKCGEVAGSDACCMTKAAKEAAATVDSAEKALEETKAAAEKPAADHPGH
jgi:hypothetical protein